MLKISDRLLKAITQLANSSYWQIVCDEYILPKMEEFNSIYDARDYMGKAKTDYELRAEILACIKAYGKMDMIMNEINKRRSSQDNDGDNNCE